MSHRECTASQSVAGPLHSRPLIFYVVNNGDVQDSKSSPWEFIS